MSGTRRADNVTEALAGTGDVVRGGERIARLAYRLRIVHPGSGPQGRIGHVALALDLSSEEAQLFKREGRLTLQLADDREIDFIVTRVPHAKGFVQVLAFNQIKHA